jgi:putative hydrolase of the HAD superfamily
MAIEAVIWDFGGVFTTSPFEAFRRYETERGLPARTSSARSTPPTGDANAWAKFERAEIDAAAFDTLFLEEATRLGHAVRGAEVLPLLYGDLRPRVLDALKTCKARFKVGCITNNVPTGHGPGMAQSATRPWRSARSWPCSTR